MTKDVKHDFICFFLSLYPILWSICSDLLPIFSWDVCFLIVKDQKIFVYFRQQSFFNCIFSKCFLPVCGLSCYSLDIFFYRADIFNFNETQIINYCLIDCTFAVVSKKLLPYSRSSKFFPIFSSMSFLVLPFTFRFKTSF